MEWRAKVIVRNGGRPRVEPKYQPERVLNGLNEVKSTLWTFGLVKQAATLDIASPETCQCMKLPFELFMNSPLPQSASSR